MQTIPKRSPAAPVSHGQPVDSLHPAPRRQPQPPALRRVGACGLTPPADTPALPASPTLDVHGHDPAAYDWVPVLRKRRVDGWSPERQRAFIGYLADTGSVRLAAQQSGMTAASAYRLRRAAEGRAFAAAWDAAIQQAAAVLVDAAFERAVHGSEEPVWDRDGNVVGRRFRQSDAMMMFLLRKHFPDRYGDNYRDRAGPAIAGTAVPPPPVDQALERLGPVPPADPAATVDPDLLDLALARADNGKLPPDLLPDPGATAPGVAEPDPPDAAFEALLEAAKAAADAPAPLADDPDIDDWYDDEPDDDHWADDDDDDDDDDDGDDDGDGDDKAAGAPDAGQPDTV